MTRRPRRLSAEERKLWDRVRRETRPLFPRQDKPERQEPSPHDFAASEIPRTETRLPQFRIGEATNRASGSAHLAPSLSDDLNSLPVRMDRKAHGRLTRGKMEPEARIDLHGMTLDRAQPALTRFILDSQAQGLRLVLVITGKGKRAEDMGPIPVRRGALKHQVPDWLAGPALRPAVLQVTPAHRRHGGSGAYYVYLRRRR